MSDTQDIRQLNVSLFKDRVTSFADAIAGDRETDVYRIKTGYGFSGELRVAKPSEELPSWWKFVQSGMREELPNYLNQTSAAVMLIHRGEHRFAFPFGQGRHLLRSETLVSDFGLKSALNSIDPLTIRSVDALTIEGQRRQTRAQVNRPNSVEAFGIDIDRDILKAVTGKPLEETGFTSVTGSGASINLRVGLRFADLGELCDKLLDLYKATRYKDGFAWVDNISRVNDAEIQEALDKKLVKAMGSRRASKEISVMPPEVIDWGSIGGFTYTYRPTPCEADLDIGHVVEIVATRGLTSGDLRGRMKVHALSEDQSERVHEWPLYKCLEFECKHGGKRYLLLGGEWFEINQRFADDVRRQLQEIAYASLSLPEVVKLPDGLWENERQYNQRAFSGNQKRFVLFDRELIRCASIPTPIEFCDLFTTSSEIVHVKFRKGGTAGLSHLFSQAYVSAQTLRRDAGFREAVRNKLPKAGKWRSLVDKTNLDPRKYTVVLAILGAEPETAVIDLTFFAQLNLLRAYRGLTAMGFGVKVIGVPMQLA